MEYRAQTGDSLAGCGTAFLVTLITLVSVVGIAALFHFTPVETVLREHAREIGALAAVVVVAVVAVLSVGAGRRRRAAELLAAAEALSRQAREARQSQLYNLTRAADGLSRGPEDMNLVETARAARAALGSLHPNDQAMLERHYRKLVSRVVADGVVDEAEREHLESVAAALQVSPDAVAKARLDGFLEVYDGAVGDGRLTEAEAARLDAIRAALGVPAAVIASQVAHAAELTEARRIEASEQRPLEGRSVRPGEDCFHSTPATEMKLVVARRRQVAGVQHKEMSLVAEAVGNLMVTNERILFVANGTTTVRMDALLDYKVDPNHGIVVLVADNRKNPIYLRVPQPYITRAHIARAWANAHGEATAGG